MNHLKDAKGALLKEHAEQAISEYLQQLEGQAVTDIYQKVLGEIEAPLLKCILIHTKDNQSKASELLGLNRGTLRKKLKQYNLL